MRITRTHRRLRSIEVSGTALGNAWCPVCNRRVAVLTEAQAAEVLAVGRQVVGELVEAGRLHGIPLITGDHGICQESLFASSTGLIKP